MCVLICKTGDPMGDESKIVQGQIIRANDVSTSVSADSCYVVEYDFAKSITSSLAWPLAILIIFLLFKKRIEFFMDKLSKARRFKAGKDGFEFELPDDFESKLAKTVSQDLDKNQKEEYLRINSLKQASPELSKAEIVGQLILKWIELEDALFAVAAGTISISSRSTAQQIIKDLQGAGEISNAQVEKLFMLREIRNRAAHKGNFEISLDAFKNAMVLMENSLIELKKKI